MNEHHNKKSFEKVWSYHTDNWNSTIHQQQIQGLQLNCEGFDRDWFQNAIMVQQQRDDLTNQDKSRNYLQSLNRVVWVSHWNEYNGGLVDSVYSMSTV